MTHSTLYWHCATYTEGGYTDTRSYRPPYQHQLIACAGIEVTEDDEARPTVQVWAIMSPTPIKPLARTLASAYELRNMVTLYGDNFGLPVLWNTALQQNVPAIGLNNGHVVHRDLVKELSGLVAPANGLTFDAVIDLLGLPLRPDLDILTAWESGDPKLQRIIPKRLIIDCCFVALVDSRLRVVRGEISAEQAETFNHAVLEAAATKVSRVRKTFAQQLGLLETDEPIKDEPAPVAPAEDELAEDEFADVPDEVEPDEVDADLTEVEPDEIALEEEFDEFDGAEEPADLVDRLEDFSSLSADDNDDDEFDDF